VGIQAVELQKSEWGDQYYLNLGVYARELGQSRSPKVYQCHLNTRAEVIDVSRQEEWRRLLDLEHPLGAQRRATKLLALLRDQVIPFMDSLGSQEGIRAAYLRGALSHAGVMLTLKHHLRLE